MQIETKTSAEVKDYAKVFWERYTELANHEAVIGMLEITSV